MSFDPKKEVQNNRKAIKPSWVDLRMSETDRSKGLERPELFKVVQNGTTVIELPKEFPNIKQKTFTEVVKLRRSTRQYSDESLSIEEVSYLLWETSRVEFVKNNAVFRTIPTGGATNAMETYVYLNNVEGLSGLYLYLQNEHKLALINDKAIKDKVNKSLFQQLRGAGVVVYLTCIPKRSEYKYSFTAHKMIAMEAGHAAQNLSLAAEIIDAGACCLAAYDQDKCDQLLEVDGTEEFTTYAITVGKR